MVSLRKATVSLSYSLTSIVCSSGSSSGQARHVSLNFLADIAGRREGQRPLETTLAYLHTGGISETHQQ
jgi:hypothetical protein